MFSAAEGWQHANDAIKHCHETAAWVLTESGVKQEACNATGRQQVQLMPREFSASATAFVVLAMQGAVSAAAWNLQSHYVGGIVALMHKSARAQF